MSQQQQQHATGMGYHRAAEDVPSFCSNGGGSDSDSTDYLYLEVGSLVRHLEDEDEDEEEEEEETAETVRRRKQADTDRIISQEASSDENDIREDKITVPENFALVKPPTARSNLLAQGLYSKLKPDRSSNHHSNHHHRHHHHHHQHHHHHHHHEPHPNHSDDHHHHHHHRHHRHHHHHHHSKHLHLVQQPQPSTVTIDAHQPSVLMNGDADEVAATTATHGDESHISKTSSVTQNCTNNHHHPSSSSSYEFEHLNHHNYYKIRKVENDSTTANIYTEKVTARIEPHQHQQHSKPIVINGVYHPQKSATAVDYQPKTDQTENAFSSEITNNTSGPIIVRNGLESEPLQPQLLTKPSSPLSLPSLPAFQKAEQHQTLNSQQQQQQQQQSPPSASPQQKPHSKPHRSKQRPSSKRRRSKRPFHRFSSHFQTALKGKHNKAEPLPAPSSSSLEAAPSESASASSSAATADTPFSPLSPDPRPLEAILYQLCLRGRLPRRTAAADAHLLRSHLLRSIAYCPLAEADSWGRRRRKRRQLLCAMCPRARYYDTRSYEHYLRHLVGHLNSRVYCSVCHAYVEGSGYYGLVHHLRGSSTSSSTGGSCCLERRMAEEEKEEADLQITAPKAMSEEGEEERRSRRRRQLLTELIEEAIDLGKNWPTLYCAFVYQGVHLDEQVFPRVSWCTTCRILTQQQLQQQQRQKELTENGQTADCQTNPIQNGANSVDQSSGSSSSSEDSLDSQLLLQQQQQQLEQGNLIESSSQQQMPDQNFDLSFDAFDTSNHREVVDLRTSPAAFFDHLVQHMFYFRYVCLPCAQRRALEFASPRSLSFQAYREVTVSFPAFNFVTREHIARFHADFSQLPRGRLFFQRFMLVGEIEAALEEHLTGTLFDLRAAEKELYRKEDVERILAEVHPVDPLRFEPRTKEVATQWPPVVNKAEEMARKKIRLAVEKKKNDMKMKMANDASDLAEQTPAIPVAKTVNGLSNGELLFGDDDSLTSSDTSSLSPSSIWQQYQEHLICTVQKATKTGIPIDELFEQEQPQTFKKLSTPHTLLSMKDCSRSAQTPELATVVPPNSCDARLTNGEILETAEVEQNRNNGTSNGITHKRVILNSSLNGDNFSRHYSGDKTTAKLATQNANSVELELEKTNNVDLSQSDDHSENNRQQLLLQQRIENLANRLNDSKGVQL